MQNKYFLYKWINGKNINRFMIFIVFLLFLLYILCGYIDVRVIQTIDTVFGLIGKNAKSEKSEIKIPSPKESPVRSDADPLNRGAGPSGSGTGSSPIYTGENAGHTLGYRAYSFLGPRLKKYVDQIFVMDTLEKKAKELLAQPETETTKRLKEDMIERMRAYAKVDNDNYEPAKTPQELGIVDLNENSKYSTPYYTAEQNGRIYECINAFSAKKEYYRRILESNTAPPLSKSEQKRVNDFAHFLEEGKTLCTTKKEDKNRRQTT